MNEVIKNLKKEIRELGEKELTPAIANTLKDLTKSLESLSEVKKMEESEEMRGRYDDRGYVIRQYDERGGGNGYNTRRYRNEDYGRYTRPMYRGNFDERLDRIMECAEMYHEDKENYHHGGSDERVIEGIENLMYAITGFIEATMDFAETPEEKNIIRKHLQKIANM